tara:strand:- start:272 stop:463 length:192 start_codon:yes stop_codon:yes gene_type:complete
VKVGDLVQLLNYGRQPMLRIGIVVGFKKFNSGKLAKVDWTIGRIKHPGAFWEQHQLKVINGTR